MRKWKRRCLDCGHADCVCGGGRLLKDIETLGTYNAEVSRGLVHAEDYAAEMAELQRRFDERTRRTA